MLFTKKRSKCRRLDTSSKCKRKYNLPKQSQPSHQLLNQPTQNDSIISLISKPSIQPESDENTIILLSNSEDSTIEFDNQKACRITIAFQFTNILLSPPKSQWTAAAKLICENLRIKKLG